jgi:predicted TIM-barrel fold metal-dependent hydrolase
MIDAHTHLWEKQHGMVNGLPVYDLARKEPVCSVVRQMTPAYITTG